MTIAASVDTPVEFTRPVLVQDGLDSVGVTDLVCGIVEKRTPRWWWYAFGVSFTVMLGGLFAACYLISTGVGVWGLNQPVGWAFDITNLVFWIGIGHAGTLISAILFLLRQKWRTSINRFAEAMTLFAVACAGIFPTIHVGRIWMLWFFAPVPNDQAIWPNFYSPLMWDAFAISTYATVSLLFWYVGLIPDLATLRDRATSRTRQFIYGLLAMGWRGSIRHWRHYETAYLMLAGLATPLVVSVHTIVSMDFATSVLPGWHATIFPPYFVAGAIFSGFAMVLTLMIPARQLFGLQALITTKHLEYMSKIILATGMIVGYAYGMEMFCAWYSGNETERFVFLNRAFGPYAWAYWTMVTCNVLVPQMFWFRKARTSPWLLFAASILVNVGMWFERFVIIVSSLHRDFIPGAWGFFSPTWVDVLQMVGAFGLFTTLILLFVRFLPMIAIAEVKALAHPPKGDPSAKPQPTSAPAIEPSAGRAIVARFPDVASLASAMKRLRQDGFTRFDAHSPTPEHALIEALGEGRSRLPWLTLAGGAAGLILGFAGMYFIGALDYPIIVGGKQPGSWQGFVPVAFETTVLLAAFATVGGLFFLCRLPRYHHPTFASEAFARATTDGFFLSIAADEPRLTKDTGAYLKELGATTLETVED